MRTDAATRIQDLPGLLAWREDQRRAGRSVAWTNGCFDLMHAGHARSLHAAARLADALVVGVNSDDSVRCLKGSARPLVPEAERAALVAALGCVDRVLVFPQLTPETVLAQLKPDVHCKGADYAPPHGKPIPERALVESWGGRVEFLPMEPGLSTTALARRLRSSPDSPASLRPAVFLGLGANACPPPVEGDALRLLAASGFLLVAIGEEASGNRSGTPAAETVAFDASYACPHGPEADCPCRLPSPGLLLLASADLGIDLRRSFLVGGASCVEAAARAGCRAVPLGPGSWHEALAGILAGITAMP